MADESNRNYFKDPTTNLWREPKTEADFTTFQAKQPKAYDTYTKTYGTPAKTAEVSGVGTYDANGTRRGSGTVNNYNGNRWGNAGNSGTGATNVASNFNDVNMDNFDSTFDAGFAGMTPAVVPPVVSPPADTGFFSGFGDTADKWLDAKTAGGSKFSNAAAGLGSLASMYYGYKGIGAAKDALNFQKEQYADQKAEQARANKKQDDFGLALASAMPAKRVG